MESKFLSENALAVIEQYRNFKFGSAVCSIPYYNNKHVRRRAGLKAQVGKGSPKDIFEEVESILNMEKIETDHLNSDNLKKFLVDHDLGVDCSGFTYHVLNKYSEDLEKGHLEKHLVFDSGGFFGKIKSRINPEKNTNVSIFANEKNSKEIKLNEVLPGDMITMINGEANREHILVIHKVTYENNQPKIIYYTHSIAWPTDGEYGHGVREGMIEITDPNKSIMEQKWLENGKTLEENYTFSRAKKSQISLRRLLFL